MKYDRRVHANLRAQCYACRLTRVAAHVGIHPSTLTQWFQCRMSIKAETIARIEAACRELGPYYSPDPNAAKMAAYYRANKARWRPHVRINKSAQSSPDSLDTT